MKLPLFNEWLNEAASSKMNLTVLIDNDPNNYNVYNYIEKYFEVKPNKIFWFNDENKLNDKVKGVKFGKELTKNINNYTIELDGRLGLAKMTDDRGHSTYFYTKDNKLGL